MNNGQKISGKKDINIFQHTVLKVHFSSKIQDDKSEMFELLRAKYYRFGLKNLQFFVIYNFRTKSRFLEQCEFLDVVAVGKCVLNLKYLLIRSSIVVFVVAV